MSSDEYALRFAEPVGPWFRWFAWHPVRTVDRGWRWLRVVWRRPVQLLPYLDGPAEPWFQTVVQRKESSDE